MLAVYIATSLKLLLRNCGSISLQRFSRFNVECWHTRNKIMQQWVKLLNAPNPQPPPAEVQHLYLKSLLKCLPSQLLSQILEDTKWRFSNQENTATWFSNQENTSTSILKKCWKWCIYLYCLLNHIYQKCYTCWVSVLVIWFMFHVMIVKTWLFHPVLLTMLTSDPLHQPKRPVVSSIRWAFISSLVKCGDQSWADVTDPISRWNEPKWTSLLG